MVDIPSIVGVSVPLLAIVAGIVETITRSQERRAKVRLRAQQGTNEEVARQLAALREEVAALRDTSTQFDMALEDSVQRLEGRVARIETKSATQSAAAPAPQDTQTLSLH